MWWLFVGLSTLLKDGFCVTWLSYKWLIGLLRSFQQMSIISRQFLGKLPVLLVHLSLHQPVSRNDYPQTWAPRRAAITSICSSLVQPGGGCSMRPPAYEGCNRKINDPSTFSKLLISRGIWKILFRNMETL